MMEGLEKRDGAEKAFYVQIIWQGPHTHLTQGSVQSMH